MADEKQFPLTESKRKSLRQKGIVPYSRMSVKTFVSGLLCLLTGALYKNIPFAFISSETVSAHQSYDTLELFYHILPWTILTACAGASAFIFIGFIQTSFLLLPPGKYPEGILSRKQESLKSLLKTFLVLSLTATISGILAGAYFNQFTKTFIALAPRADPIHILYLFRVLPLDTLLYVSGMYLLLVSVLSFIHARFSFLEHHKMTRGELLEEITDS